VKHDSRGTYKTESVCTRTFLDVFRQVSAGHPFRDELEWSRGDTEEGDNISVLQALPHHRPLVKGLEVSSGTVGRNAVAAERTFVAFPGPSLE